ncbi:MAG: MBL fold metallo-hydrolase [Vicinamibacteria bacterium]|nr:MBL fold metallo-hydrolase [Vicinamibacteria bacterium]
MTCTLPDPAGSGSQPPPPQPTFEFRQFYLGCLAQASYLLGSEGEAAVVDPRRDIDIYIDEAKASGLSIRYVIETHLHADFVSGHRELAERTGAIVLISHRAAATFAHQAVKDGDIVRVGALSLAFLETPGHTPESISVLVTDTKVSSQPQMVLTGDTLFIGDVGRPDLLGSKGLTAEHMAGVLYDSLQAKLLPLPDDVLVYPAHGAGSLCGKNLSKDTYSTMGRQRETNVALQPMSRDEFVRFLTEDAPETPQYFPMDVEINRRGAPNLDALTAPPSVTAVELKSLRDEGAIVLDVRSSDDYAIGSVPQSMNIGLSGQFASWAGTLLDANRDLLIVAPDEAGAAEAKVRLARVGLERVVGWLAGGIAEWRQAGFETVATAQVTVKELQDRLADTQAGEQASFQVLDVRRKGEWTSGHIKGAVHAPLHLLEEQSAYFDPALKTYVICGGGYRSMMGVEVLRELGIRDVVDVKGGMSEWNAQALPTTLA